MSSKLFHRRVATPCSATRYKQSPSSVSVTVYNARPDIGPEELKEKQRSDTTLKKYWDLVSKPESKGKPQFIVKKDILYRKYTSKQGDTKIQLVVPTEMREMRDRPSAVSRCIGLHSHGRP